MPMTEQGDIELLRRECGSVRQDELNREPTRQQFVGFHEVTSCTRFL